MNEDSDLKQKLDEELEEVKGNARTIFSKVLNLFKVAVISYKHILNHIIYTD